MIAEVVRRSVTGLAVLFSGLFYVAASRVNSPRLSVVLIRRRAFRCQGDGIISGGLIWCDRDKDDLTKKPQGVVPHGETAQPPVLVSRMGLGLPLEFLQTLAATPTLLK